VEGYQNYDKSEFADKSALFDGNDEKLEELWKSEFSLKEFTEKKQFKSYEQLKGRLDKALGLESVQPRSKAADTSPTLDEEVNFDSAGVDDEDLDYFKSLANAD
jgi:hypothetical protein